MKIVFTVVSRARLKDIYLYYKREASLKIAKGVKNNIIEGINMLRTHPELGNVEEYLAYLNWEHRKLIIGNYKVIYRIIEDTVVIDTIFDSRQEPLEMLRDVK